MDNGDTTTPHSNLNKVIDRFSVTAADALPDTASQSVRSSYVEEAWLPFLRPTALLFARRCDELLSSLHDGQQSVAIIVARWSEALGVYPEEILAARNRLIRFGFASWDGTVMSLKRHWPIVPAAIQTPEHRAALMSIPDFLPEAMGMLVAASSEDGHVDTR